MHQNPAQFLAQAEALLSSRRYRDALDLLQNLDGAPLSGSDRGYWLLLISEANIRLGIYDVAKIDEAIEHFRFTSFTDKFARAKFLKGWYLILTGQHFESKEVLTEAYVQFLRCNDFHGAAQALNFLSQASFQTGNISGAIEHLSRAADLLGRSGDSGNQIVATMNLAYLTFVAGHLQQALTLYASIEKEIFNQGDRNACIYAYMYAVPLSQVGRFQRASELLKVARVHSEGLPREQGIIFENTGYLCILNGNYAEASRSLKSGLELSLQLAPESALVSQIKRLFGDLYIATRKYDLAERYATEALAVAEKIGQKLEIAACWRVCAQVETHRGNKDIAKGWFKKALDLFNLISARYELAMTRYLAACSGLYDQAERLALLHLAKEYFETEEVVPYIERVQAELAKPTLRLSPAPTPKAEIVTADRTMLRLLDLARHVAPTTMTVLLTGETGTGKDLLARYIHECSGRGGNFVTQNFAALPSALAEAELFGYHKGAYTGASQDKPGLFEEAQGGTFFLNEIAEAGLELQSKLLEVLETRMIRRLGETKERPVDVRIIAATNHDLQQAIKENRFRPDLYHRLNEISMHLPSLAERKDDVPLLARRFMAEVGCDCAANGNLPEAERLVAILAAYSWPGNVRELRAQIRKLYITAEGDLGRMIALAMEHLGITEDAQLVRLLEQHNWNRTRAAQTLGVSEGTIRKRMRKFNLNKE